MSAFLRLFVITIVVVVAVPPDKVNAQSTITNRIPDSERRGDNRNAASSRSKTSGQNSDARARSIYMVLQTESTLTQAELRDRFEQAREGCKDCSVDTYDIHPIEHSTYVLLKSITKGDGVPRDQANSDEVKIKSFEGKDGEWTINLRSGTKYLESAKVKVVAPGGQEEVIQMTAQPKDKANADLRYYSPGTYILTVPAGKQARSATLMITDEAKGAQTTPVPVEVPWPDDGRCFLVTLKGVQGDETKLYDTLKDPKIISNPLKGLEDATNAAILVGSFTEATVVVIEFKDDAIQLTFPKPGGGVEPKRMWMRFPLTKADETALSKELDAKFAGDGFKTVPDWIRQNLLGENLTPEGSTGWFELPWNAKHQQFEKTLPIDTKSWQQRLINNKEFMGENAILIYEFDGPDGSQRINKLDNGKYYRPYQVAGWLTGLPNAHTAEK